MREWGAYLGNQLFHTNYATQGISPEEYKMTLIHFKDRGSWVLRDRDIWCGTKDSLLTLLFNNCN